MISVQTHKHKNSKKEHCRNILHLFTSTVGSDLTSLSFGSTSHCPGSDADQSGLRIHFNVFPLKLYFIHVFIRCASSFRQVEKSNLIQLTQQKMSKIKC